MTELTLDNLNEDFIDDNMKEVTHQECWGNMIHHITTLYGVFKLGKYELDIHYNPQEEKPWSIDGGVGNYKLYKNFTGLKNYIKKTNQYN